MTATDEQKKWPHEDTAALDAFYGDPRGRNGLVSPTWYSNNIIRWTPPYNMYYSEGHVPLKTLLIHKKCKPAFDAAFTEVYNFFKVDGVVEQRLNISGGTYNFRLMRGGSKLSVHAYGIAIDMDPEHNPFPHHWTPNGISKDFVAIMEKHGFYWRGTNGDIDPMHFQLTYR
jgi:hypothetical protein